MSRFINVFIFAVFIAGVTGCMSDPGTDPSAGSTEQGTAEQASSATPNLRNFSGVNANVVTLPVVGCRRVTSSSIAVFTTATSSTVVCRFLQNDQFIFIGTTDEGGGRVLTWCGRGTAPNRGVFSWAQLPGTVAVAC
jgi:hypothetical protein